MEESDRAHVRLAELGAILAGTNIIAVLHSDNTAIERARQAIHERIGS